MRSRKERCVQERNEKTQNETDTKRVTYLIIGL